MNGFHAGLILLAGTLLAAATPAQRAVAQAPAPRAPAEGLDAARSAFDALTEPERKAVQDGLIWTGTYSGVADGSFGRQTFDAIAAYQRGNGRAPSGILSPADRRGLQADAQRAKAVAGFTTITDPKTGIRLGVPAKLLPKQDANPNGGSRWQSTDGRVTLDTRLAPPDATLQSLYERNVGIRTQGRVVTYKILRADFFVIAGETPTGKFYTRYAVGDQGLRGFSLGYDKELAPLFDRVAVAVANSFEPFPAAAPTPVPAPVQAPASPPPPVAARSPRLVGTGLVIGPGRVLASVPAEGCREPRALGIKAEARAEAPSILIVAGLPAKSPLPSPGAPPDDGAALLVVTFAEEEGQPALTAIPAAAVGGRHLIAPLQPGAAGAPVLDAGGRLVGVMGPVAATTRRIAGIMPAARHAFIGVQDLPVTDLAAVPPAPSPARELSSADQVAGIRSALVPITCAP